MNVLIDCEFTGKVRDEFIKRGHEAWSCDLLPTESTRAGNHHIGDAIKAATTGWVSGYSINKQREGEFYRKWDLLIAHPPCTRLCNSGVRWLNERNLWEDMRKAALFFKALLDCDIPEICIENPIPHKYAVEIIGRKYDQIIQPWQFGHGETKATCLWLKNLPPLEPTNIVEGRENRIHKMSPSKDRSKHRSITYQGIAEAMASQWSQ